MKLYEFWISRSIRCHWLLNELGIEWESVNVDLQNGKGQDPEYLKIHPLGKVPALVDGDFKIFESAAILTYLADKYPEKGLIPKAGTFERGHYDQWMAFCLTEMDAVLWTRSKHRFVLPEEMRVPEVNAGCDWEFKKNVKALEAHLSGNDFLVGNKFSAVDVMVTQTLHWANMLELLGEAPNCVAYMNRMKEREAFPRDMYKD